jgi:DNA polymerase-3 subunit gamma/tau
MSSRWNRWRSSAESSAGSPPPNAPKPAPARKQGPCSGRRSGRWRVGAAVGCRPANSASSPGGQGLPPSPGRSGGGVRPPRRAVCLELGRCVPPLWRETLAQVRQERGGQAPGNTLNPTTAGGESAKDGGEPAKAGGEPATVGGESATVGGEPATVREESAKVGGEPAKAGGEPANAGGEFAKVGGEPAKAGGESATAGGEPAKVGGESATAGETCAGVSALSVRP